jgi:protein-disulfide isomerase
MSMLLDRPMLTVPVSADRDHTIGPPTAAVTLLEYGDYECPFCGRAHPEVLEAVRAMGDDLQFAFRHFPLSQIHPHSFGAALAAEAAGGQGAFWPMHDMLFEHQDRLDPADLVGYAEALGLDVDRFVRDLEGRTYEPKVRDDFMTGVRSGVNGTPTFFINGVRHNGGWDARSLLAAIRAEL